MTNDEMIKMIKYAISNANGWLVLAESVRFHPQVDPETAKSQCIELLKEIAGDREIDLPTVGGVFIVKFADVLIQQLEYNISLVEASKKS